MGIKGMNTQNTTNRGECKRENIIPTANCNYSVSKVWKCMPKFILENNSFYLKLGIYFWPQLMEKLSTLAIFKLKS